MSKVKRRIPQQGRGERRVAALLEAAAAVIAERGYEAATMTEMAERAGASIGAMYQYFPNKEAVVNALRTQYGNEMDLRWREMVEHASSLDTAELVDRIFEVMVELMKARPAFLPLLSAPKPFKRDPVARNELRTRFANLFREMNPSLTPEQAFRVANVALQVVKGMNPLYADANTAERAEVVREFRMVLTAYLTARLRSSG